MTDTDAAAFSERIKAMCAFVEARCTEDEIWAREASRFDPDPNQEGHTVPDLPEGMHWRWGYGDNWAEVAPDMSIDPQMGKLPDPDEWHQVTLVSVETWTWDHGNGTVWDMHEQVIDGSEVRTAAAGHIIRHDPARVLREVTAKRSRAAALLTYARKADEARESPDRFGDGNRGEILGMLMAHMHAVSADAEVWSGHPAYDATWRVGP